MGTKVVNTRLSPNEHKKMLRKCNERGCNSADFVRDAILQTMNGQNDHSEGIAVLHEDLERKGEVRIKSSRFPDLDDTELIGLVGTRNKPGSDSREIVFLPFNDADDETIRVKRWPDAGGEIYIGCDNEDECYSLSY